MTIWPCRRPWPWCTTRSGPGNNALASGDTARAAAALAAVRAMLGVLGLDPLSEPWASAEPGDDLHAVVGALVTVALTQRQAARERRDYAAADAIRDDLQAAGHPHRGHPARAALGAEAVTGGAAGGGSARSGRGGRTKSGKPRPGHRRLRQEKARRQGTDAAALICGPVTRRSAGRPRRRPGSRRAAARDPPAAGERTGTAGPRTGQAGPRTAAAGRRTGRVALATPPRWWPAATRCWSPCAPASPRPRSTQAPGRLRPEVQRGRSGSPRTSASR